MGDDTGSMILFYGAITIVTLAILLSLPIYSIVIGMDQANATCWDIPLVPSSVTSHLGGNGTIVIIYDDTTNKPIDPGYWLQISGWSNTALVLVNMP